MIPIHELLNRIRWDSEFAEAEFVIGYYDRLSERTIRVPFTALSFPADDHFRFALVDEEGAVHNIPYHRVREVFRNGRLIWHREHKGLQ
jgi:uncharacterized protein (UPF0248 family)